MFVSHRGRWNGWGRIDMPRSPLQRVLRIVGTLAVVAILGFLLLPAVVVTLAAFNDQALPSVSAANLVVALVRQGYRL